MKQKELTKTLMVISVEKTTLVSMAYTKIVGFSVGWAPFHSGRYVVYMYLTFIIGWH